MPGDDGRALFSAMQKDTDIAAEAASLQQAMRRLEVGEVELQPPAASTAPTGSVGPPLRHVRLNWYPNQGGHQPNNETRRLLQEVGGTEALAHFTQRFYEKCFQDPHIDRFIREHSDPHGTRFALWITEKFGGGDVWTAERAKRKTCPFSSHGHVFQTPHDRSSAHFAAWHSPKREPEKFGQHFKLHDCRRLHFWAMRECGIFERSPSFAEYYIKFIAHFVSVYERTAPAFARDSARWSADPQKTQAYLQNGRVMTDVLGLSLRDALAQLPTQEREPVNHWPYC